VPRSGAADPDSLRLANNLVGNEPGAACLEATLGRITVRFAAPAVAALTGAPAPIRVTHPGEQTETEMRPPHGEAFTVPPGATLRLGAPPSGLRSYLAVAGGIDVTPALGSRSGDLLSGLGPGPLQAGDRLPLGPYPVAGRQPTPHAAGAAAPASPPAGSSPPEPSLPGAAGVTATLRVIPGPRDDWFAPGALAVLTSAEDYVVSPASNRTGLRLTGPVLPRATAVELPSEGMATGSLQVSHDGQPILLLADHPTTGGYPVIAVVLSADIGLAAQLRPGQRVRFQVRT
jgi:biotin-dependent carboxylase-like uncharacterized protein